MPEMNEIDKNALASKYLGLVHACCRRYKDKGIEYDELFSAGCLGLSKALENFDSGRGLQFSTYAFPVIMGELKQLFRSGGTVKVSRSLRELGMKIARLNSDNIKKHGEELTVSQLSEMLGVTAEQIADAIGAAKFPLSLSAGDDEDSENHSPVEIPSPDIQYEISERLTLRNALDSLGQDDRRLIVLRYFMDKTQVQTAEMLRMTQVQVSRREKKILTLMRERMSDN